MKQTLLITGASDGIGLALAIQYAAAGARVLGVGRRPYPPALAGSVLPEDYSRPTWPCRRLRRSCAIS